MSAKRRVANKIIIVAFLTVFMVFSSSGLSPGLGIESTEREVHETDYSNRSPKTLVRAKSVQHNQFIIDRTPFHFLMISVVFYFLLAAPWIHLRPLYALFMKSTLLLPIKFTSKFVV